jgi:uncharacterized phage-like protein YoqJ
MPFEICCFTGHRVIPAAHREELCAILDRRLAALSDIGFTEFRTGGARGFDTLAAQRVLHLRKTHPQCKLCLILPCQNQDASWNERERADFASILQNADKVTYIQQHYTSDCMHARNRSLVEGSDLCLAYLTSNRGGTLYTCSYALKKGVRLINLADEIPK